MRTTVDRLQFGKPHDHDGLVDEHFIHAHDMLVPLLAHIFNRATSEGFATSLIKHTILAIFDFGDPLIPCDYRAITIRHYLTRLYGSIVASELNVQEERNVCSSAGQAGFSKGLMLCGFRDSLHHCTAHLAHTVTRSPWSLGRYAIGNLCTI